MKTIRAIFFIPAIFLLVATLMILCVSQTNAQLPIGIKAVWDMKKVSWEKTIMRERVCLNGLWCWQTAGDITDVAPHDKWDYFKVPGSWPGIADYMQKESETVHAHPSWKDQSLSSINTAWYQREITIPDCQLKRQGCVIWNHQQIKRIKNVIKAALVQG